MTKKGVPTPEQVKKEFGNSRRKAAAALGVTTQAIGYWFKIGRVPDASHYRLAAVRPAKWGHLVQ